MNIQASHPQFTGKIHIIGVEGPQDLKPGMPTIGFPQLEKELSKPAQSGRSPVIARILSILG